MKENMKKESEECRAAGAAYPNAPDENWRRLAAAIVAQAIRDYQIAVEKHDSHEICLLRKFFASEWCEALIGVGTGMNCCYEGDDIVNRVECESCRSNDKKRRCGILQSL